MSLSSDGTMLTMPVAPANTGNGNGFGWGGDGAWWIVLFLIFAAFGGWGNGFGFGGGGSSYARRGTHYVRGHYSRDGAKDDMKRQLQEMLDNADDDTIRNAIQRCMDAVEG